MARSGKRAVDAAIAAGGAVVLAAALVTELRKPAAERTWHGTAAGLVPYDFRPPTPRRVRARLWDPEGRLFTPHLFGVGWTLNLGRVFRWAAGRGRFRRD